jgi:integrase
VVAQVDAAAPWFRIAVVLGAGLGLRQAEAAGLTADRIDWLGRTVLVDRQWTSRRGICGVRTTQDGEQPPGHPGLELGARRLSEHVGRRHDGFVLHRDGEPVRHGMFNGYWVRARDDAGLGGTRYHDLRQASPRR